MADGDDVVTLMRNLEESLERAKVMRPEDECERCHERPHAWFTDAGYLCGPCDDEWNLWRFVVKSVVGCWVMLTKPRTQWTAQVNDLVGGWIVTDYPHPHSAHDAFNIGGDPKKRGYIIAECMTEQDATRIASLLNEARYRRRRDG